jgi:hypothetical protein
LRRLLIFSRSKSREILVLSGSFSDPRAAWSASSRKRPRLFRRVPLSGFTPPCRVPGRVGHVRVHWSERVLTPRQGKTSASVRKNFYFESLRRGPNSCCPISARKRKPTPARRRTALFFMAFATPIPSVARGVWPTSYIAISQNGPPNRDRVAAMPPRGNRELFLRPRRARFRPGGEEVFFFGQNRKEVGSEKEYKKKAV